MFDASGKLISNTNTINASSGPVALTAKAVDTNGNPIVSPNALTFTLSAVGSGTYRLTQTGTDVTEATIKAGTAGLTLYYVNGGTGDTAIVPATANSGALDMTLGTPSYDATAQNVWVSVKDATPANLSGVVVKFLNNTTHTYYTATTDSNGYAGFNLPTVNGTDNWTVSIVGTGLSSTGVLASGTTPSPL